MDNLLSEVPHVFIYLDDILIGTPHGSAQASV